MNGLPQLSWWLHLHHSTNLHRIMTLYEIGMYSKYVIVYVVLSLSARSEPVVHFVIVDIRFAWGLDLTLHIDDMEGE
jgi:hypothetical protein